MKIIICDMTCVLLLVTLSLYFIFPYSANKAWNVDFKMLEVKTMHFIQNFALLLKLQFTVQDRNFDCDFDCNDCRGFCLI